jgi:hypothetical protein
MPLEILVSLISLAGVVSSLLISYLVSNRQIRVQLESVRYQLAQSYTEKLYLKRLDVYPALYEIISRFAKRMRRENISQAEFNTFVEEVNAWDSKYALLVSAFAAQQLITLRKTLRALELSQGETLSKETLCETLFPLILELELAMKTELGVFASDGYHSPTEVKPLREVLDSLRSMDKDHSAMKHQ